VNIDALALRVCHFYTGAIFPKNNLPDIPAIKTLEVPY
jgi:hypothetical protein